jgi:uncharacterized protein with HEPN domain
MLSETERDSPSDILFNIDLANSFAQGFDYERFLADMRTFYAIRHEHEDVAHRLVWGTVHEFLPALRVMAKAELAAEGC